MSLKLKYHWKLMSKNVATNYHSLKKKSKNWNVTKIKMSLNLKCLSYWNVTKTEMSLLTKCHREPKMIYLNLKVLPNLFNFNF